MRQNGDFRILSAAIGQQSSLVLGELEDAMRPRKWFLVVLDQIISPSLQFLDELPLGGSEAGTTAAPLDESQSLLLAFPISLRQQRNGVNYSPGFVRLAQPGLQLD